MAEQLLTIRDVATRLQVDPRTVRNWIKAAKFPAPIRLPGGLRWEAETVERWLKEK